MRKLLLSISFVLFFNWAFSQEEAKVKACYEGYKSAILKSDGETGLKFINQKTKDYYQDILTKALHADSLAIENLNVIDKVTVLRVRMALPARKIEEMNGERFFVYAINAGMVGKNSVQNVELGEVTINGKHATGEFVNLGKVAPFTFGFDKEKGDWKIDLTSLFPMSNQGLELMIESGSYEENKFILRILGSLSEEGQTPGVHLWKPLK